MPTPGSGLQDITVGPDGSVWFPEAKAGKIGQLTQDGQIHEYLTPTLNSQPDSITVGGDGNIYFTEAGASAIGKIVAAPLGVGTVQAEVVQGMEGEVAGSRLVAVATFTDNLGTQPVSEFSATVTWQYQDGLDAARALGNPPSWWEARLGPNYLKELPTRINTRTVITAAPGFFGGTTYTVWTAIPNLIQDGVIPIQVAIQAQDGRASNFSTHASVADAPLQLVQTHPVTGVAGVGLNNVSLLDFKDLGGADSAGFFTARIVWDAQGQVVWSDTLPTTPGVVNGRGGLFSVAGSHVYSQPGTYWVHVLIQDEGGSSLEVITSVTITGGNSHLNFPPATGTKNANWAIPSSLPVAVVEPMTPNPYLVPATPAVAPPVPGEGTMQTNPAKSATVDETASRLLLANKGLRNSEIEDGV